MQGLDVNGTIEYAPLLLVLLRICWDCERLLASPATGIIAEP